jgi:hypothetical protein
LIAFVHSGKVKIDVVKWIILNREIRTITQVSQRTCSTVLVFVSTAKRIYQLVSPPSTITSPMTDSWPPLPWLLSASYMASDLERWLRKSVWALSPFI